MSETYKSETAKYRHLTVPYCVGNGVDLGSGGDPVVPHAISVDLPESEYAYYNSNQPHRGHLNFRGDARIMPFKDGMLDWVYSSHLLEDFLDWNPILDQWAAALKRGGHMIILVPDKKLWNEAVAAGQPPNCQHQHESHVGELTRYMLPKMFRTIMDCMAKPEDPKDYTIIYVGQKL